MRVFSFIKINTKKFKKSLLFNILIVHLNHQTKRLVCVKIKIMKNLLSKICLVLIISLTAWLLLNAFVFENVFVFKF